MLDGEVKVKVKEWVGLLSLVVIRVGDSLFGCDIDWGYR